MGGVDEGLDALAKAGVDGAAYLVTDGSSQVLLTEPDAAGLAAALPADRSDAWRGLDVTIAHLCDWYLRGARPDVIITGHTHMERLDYRDGVLQLNPGSCVNDAPPASPTMSANTGLIYVGAGNGNTTSNAPSGQPSSAGGTCGAVVPSYAGHYPLAVTLKYNFKPLTPFGSQFFPGGIVMTVTSTMSTEY